MKLNLLLKNDIDISELKDKYPNRNNVIISGFGAGLSWASALVDLSSCKISNLIEY